MNSIETRIHMALSQLKRNIDSDISHFGNCEITRAQLTVLHAIQTHGICKLTQLADIMEVKPSAITVMMDRLEKVGYIKRAHDTADRRAVLVEVTESGKAALEKAMQQREQVLKSYLAALDPDEIVTLTELLEKVVAARKTDWM